MNVGYYGVSGSGGFLFCFIYLVFTPLEMLVHVEIFSWVVKITYVVMSYLFILYLIGGDKSLISIFNGFGDFGVLFLCKKSINQLINLGSRGYVFQYVCKWYIYWG